MLFRSQDVNLLGAGERTDRAIATRARLGTQDAAVQLHARLVLFRRVIRGWHINGVGELGGRGTPWRNILTTTLPVAAGIFAITWLLARSVWIAALPALAFSGISGFSNLLYAARISRLQALIGRPESVELIEVEASSAEVLQHQGSNGPAYCFFSDDGQIGRAHV